MWFLEHAWLIPVIPAVSFALIILFGKRLPKKGSEIGLLAIATCFVLSVGTAAQWIDRVGDAEDHATEETTTTEGEHALGAPGRSAVVLATEAESTEATTEGAEATAAEGTGTEEGTDAEHADETGVTAAEGEEHAEEGEHHARPAVEPVRSLYTWWQSGGHTFTFGSHVDGLAVALLIVVSIISGLVQMFSVEYVRGDRRFTHYYAALSLFTAGMFCLVTAPNMLQLLLGWEIMGLCSFMLIGHWWEEYPNQRAAMKAFFTTRTGDTGLLIGIAILYFATRSFDIRVINDMAASGEIRHLVVLMASLSMLWAIIGKSGQFPLHTWLPDAMAGPTPVSALIHAATMVVAGVYLGARVYPVFYEGFSIADGGANMMAIIGAITIVIAAALAFVQVDIKKVLAYSTVSQLGYMVMGLGVGAWTAAVFHIFTHAFFKALLFLGAGSVAHSGSHHSFDMKTNMGGLRKHMPITATTFIIGTLALAGIFPFAGFFSKDEILANAGHNGYTFFMIVGLVGAFMTAAYMTRCYYLTFEGEHRGGHDDAHDDAHADTHANAHAAAAPGHDAHAAAHGHDTHDAHAPVPHGASHGAHDDHGGHAGPHESPWLLTVPLVILAVLATTSGFLNAVFMDIEKFMEWVEPTVAFPAVVHAPFKWSEAGLSVAIAVAGIIISFIACKAVYERGALKGATERNKFARAGYKFLWNRYYLDHLYEKVIVAGITGPIARAMNWVNQKVIDGVVNAAGTGAREGGRWVYRKVDQMVVDGAVNGAGLAADQGGKGLRLLQTGKVQAYGALLFAAAAVGALILVIVV